MGPPARRAVSTRLFLVLLVASLGLMAPVAAVAEDAPKPDIVVLMADDLGYIEDERILKRLPNITSLWLEGGLGFTNAYGETPLCCPGRAGFLTGQHTRHHRVNKNIARLLKPTHTIATALDAVGYRTVMVGKYMNRPLEISDYTPPGWDRFVMLTSVNHAVSTNWLDNGEPLSTGFSDRYVWERGLAELEATPMEVPLFMWLNPRAPHKGYAPPRYELPDIDPAYRGDTRCDGIAPYKPPTYLWPRQPNGFPLTEICRSLLLVDDMVGAMRASAEARGRSVTWVLTSDNGMAWGAYSYKQKRAPWATHVPLYVAGPNVVPGRTNALVSSIDLAPTLAELAGTVMPRADGVSFASVLSGTGTGREYMIEDADVTIRPNWYAVRTPRWRLLWWGDHWELFDQVRDPYERRNVRRKNPSVVRALRTVWSNYLAGL